MTGASAEPGAASSEADATNLIPQRGTFVGRAGDLAALAALFDRGERLVTLTGVGGIGKTRLALEYAARVLPVYRVGGGGVWVCDLSEARDLRSACAAIAHALRAPLAREAAPGEAGDDGGAAQIGRALAARGPALVVLDTFEQLCDHAAATVGLWLALAPQVRFLVTSRELLRVPGEYAVELGPLGVPARDLDAAASEAVQLLVERAERVRPGGVALGDPAHAPVLAAIARALDGIPLAIELAAARLSTLDPPTLLARLRSQLVDVLARGPRDAARRQATMRASIAWSWDLMSAAEQQALAQCSVFRGGFDLEAAEAVLALDPATTTSAPGADGAASVLDVVQSLREASLVRVYQPEGAPARQRLGLYASVREFAAEKLAAVDGTAAAEARHAAFYLDVAEGWAEGVDGRDGAEMLARLGLERENLLAVVERALADGGGDAASRDERALRAAVALKPVFLTRGPLEAYIALLDAVLGGRDGGGGAGAPSSARARALVARGAAHRRMGQLDESVADLQAAVALARRADARAVQASALRTLAASLEAQGRTDAARAAGAEAIALLRALGDAPQAQHGGRGDGAAVWSLGNVMAEGGHRHVAQEYIKQALAIFQRSRNVRGEGSASTALGHSYLEEGRVPEARACFERALSIHRKVINWWFESYTLFGLGLALHGEGRLDDARARYDEALRIIRAAGDLRFEAIYRGYVGLVLAEQGRAADAYAELDAACTALARIGDQRYEALFLAHLGALEAQLHRADQARAFLEDAEALLAGRSDAFLAVAALERGQLDLLAAREARRAGDLAAAARAEAAARERLGAAKPAAARSIDVRLATRRLASALAADAARAASAPAVDSVRPPAPPPTATAPDASGRSAALVVHPEGRWFVPPGGALFRCETRRAMRLILLALVTQRQRAPGVPLAASALVAAGWPGVKIQPEAASNRLHVALNALRTFGLREVLLARGGGYLLDPDVQLEMAADAPA